LIRFRETDAVGAFGADGAVGVAGVTGGAGGAYGGVTTAGVPPVVPLLSATTGVVAGFLYWLFFRIGLWPWLDDLLRGSSVETSANHPNAGSLTRAYPPERVTSEIASDVIPPSSPVTDERVKTYTFLIESATGNSASKQSDANLLEMIIGGAKRVTGLTERLSATSS
jgi:hypothetical protein